MNDGMQTNGDLVRDGRIIDHRRGPHSYDREMDCDPRDFYEEDVEQIETFAKHHLGSAFPSKNTENSHD